MNFRSTKHLTSGIFPFRHCKEAENMVNKFKAGIQAVDTECRHMAATCLLKADKKRLFEVAEFAQVQADYQADVSSCSVLCMTLISLECCTRTFRVHACPIAIQNPSCFLDLLHYFYWHTDKAPK
jgi:hypothetical protein